MASRWRTWDLDGLDEINSRKEDDIEPLILPSWRNKITHIDLSKIVLPKEAYFSSEGNSRTRGRGRSLANRALGCDKPSRRPGERKPSDTVAKEKPKTLGSKFFGFEYLSAEQFPSLQSSATRTDTRPSIKKGKGKKESSGKINKNTNNCKEEIRQNKCTNKSDNLNDDDETKISDQFSDSDQLGFGNEENLNSKEYLQEAEEVNNKDNLFQEYDNEKIENCKQLSDKVRLEDNQYSKDDSQNDMMKDENVHVDKQYSNEGICNELSTSSSDETVIVDEVWDSNGQASPDSHLSWQEDTQESATPLEDTNSIVSAGINQLTSPRPQCIKADDTRETLEESMDMSTSDMEMEPCNVLLENLPLALTEEELHDIVEPYGEMESYTFDIKDDSKTCSIRMPSSMGGELLVVSLDGLEVDGHRIKAILEEI